MDFAVAFLLTHLTQTSSVGSALSTVNIGTIIQTSGSIGAFGLIAWVLKRVFTHTIPRMAVDFKDSLESQSRTFASGLQTQREMFEVEVIRMREDFRAELSQQRQDFKDEIRRERDFFGQQLERLTQAINQLEQTLQEGRSRR